MKTRSKKLIAQEIATWDSMSGMAPVLCIDVVIRVLTEDIALADLPESLNLGGCSAKTSEAYEIAEYAWNWLHLEENVKPSKQWMVMLKERTGDFDFSKHRR